MSSFTVTYMYEKPYYYSDKENFHYPLNATNISYVDICNACIYLHSM